jgi:hypothetical protein
MRVGEFGVMIQINAEYWSTIRETPIWLDIKNIPPQGGYWFYSPQAHERLAALEREFPPRLIRKADSLLIPIQLPFEVERTEVMRLLLQQVNDVVCLLA